VRTWWWFDCELSLAPSWFGGGGGGGLVLGRRGDPPPLAATLAGANGIDGPTYAPENVYYISSNACCLHISATNKYPKYRALGTFRSDYLENIHTTFKSLSKKDAIIIK